MGFQLLDYNLHTRAHEHDYFLIVTRQESTDSAHVRFGREWCTIINYLIQTNDTHYFALTPYACRDFDLVPTAQ
jgi:hypothetical protein